MYILKNKNDSFRKFKEWKVLIKTQTSRKTKRLRTDNGLEFCDGMFNQFCNNTGISKHYTVKETPQQNSLAERKGLGVCCLMQISLRIFWLK